MRSAGRPSVHAVARLGDGDRQTSPKRERIAEGQRVLSLQRGSHDGVNECRNRECHVMCSACERSVDTKVAVRVWRVV